MKKSMETGGLAILTLALAIGLALSPSIVRGEEMMGAMKGEMMGTMMGEMMEPLKFDQKGNLIRLEPDVYREWTIVGTPVTPNDMNDGKAPFPEFHHVYIDPATWDHYKKTGEFRDGGVLIKELISVGSKKAASGNGYFMGDFIGLEAAVKDSKRFPKEPGHWAYFSFSAGVGMPLKDKVAAEPTASCNTCHQGNAAQDWVFTQYYPVLRWAKPSGM